VKNDISYAYGLSVTDLTALFKTGRGMKRVNSQQGCKFILFIYLNISVKGREPIHAGRIKYNEHIYVKQ